LRLAAAIDSKERQMMGARLIGLSCAVFLAACVPELQPEEVPCTQDSVPYDQAPDSWRTPQLEEAIARYEALAGRWRAGILCPPDQPTARSFDFVIQVKPRSEIHFSTGCGLGETAVTTCQVELSSQDLPELDGQSKEFSVAFHGGRVKVALEQLLDPSYAPGLYVLMMVVEVDATGVVSGWLT
jgi:hypothetical protein